MASCQWSRPGAVLTEGLDEKLARFIQRLPLLGYPLPCGFELSHPFVFVLGCLNAAPALPALISWPCRVMPWRISLVLTALALLERHTARGQRRDHSLQGVRSGDGEESADGNGSEGNGAARQQ